MKSFAILLIAVFAFGMLSSCKKCTSCTYTVQGVEHNSGEFCGKKDEVEEFEKDFEEKVGAITGQSVCTQD